MMNDQEEPVPPQLMLDWQRADEAHITRHGVSRRQIEDMIGLRFWVRLANPRGGPNRHLVIGLTGAGRLITLVVQATNQPEVFVPITCWPSTEKERAIYWKRFR